MIIDRILRKGQGQGQVTKGHYMLTLWFSHVTHVLWSNFDVELENHGYFTIGHICYFKKIFQGQVKKVKVKLISPFLTWSWVKFILVLDKIRSNGIITTIFELYVEIGPKIWVTWLNHNFYLQWPFVTWPWPYPFISMRSIIIACLNHAYENISP